MKALLELPLLPPLLLIPSRELDCDFGRSKRFGSLSSMSEIILCRNVETSTTSTLITFSRILVYVSHYHLQHD